MKKSIAIVCCDIILAHSLGLSPQNSSFIAINNVSVSNQLPSPIQAIIPTFEFKCQSLVTGGNIQAVGDLNFDLQIWRPLNNSGRFYNLVWRKVFRRNSISNNGQMVSASFTMSPGIPVRRKDVIGFYSNESARILVDSSEQHEVYFLQAGHGPLCNFSLDGNGVQQRGSILPLISLSYVNATNQELQAAELRLPMIDGTCITVESTITDNNVMTTSINTLSSGSSERSEPNVTTQSSLSNLISGANTTEGGSGDGFFLTLSLTEFILVVIVLLVIFISICVVIIIACCCCMYVLHTANCKSKDESISMNSNPVYDSIRTPVQTSCVGAQPMPCTGGQQPTLIALVPPCNQAALSTTSLSGCQQASSDRITLSSVDSYSSTSLSNPRVHPSDSENYNYPKLRVHFHQHNDQRTSDGYIVVQPDNFVQNDSQENIHNATLEAENHGPRGLMDHTL